LVSVARQPQWIVRPFTSIKDGFQAGIHLGIEYASLLVDEV
jgi:hypothetical protein